MVNPGSRLKAQGSTFNIQHSTINIQRSTFNDQHSTINIQRSTFNDQHSAINIQRSTFSDQHSKSSIISSHPVLLHLRLRASQRRSQTRRSISPHLTRFHHRPCRHLRTRPDERTRRDPAAVTDRDGFRDQVECFLPEIMAARAQERPLRDADVAANPHLV